MFRTLSLKLILAFLLVSLTVALLGGLIARWLTQQEFQNLVIDQAQSRFIAEASAYYQAFGTWQGVAEHMRLRGPGLQLPLNDPGRLPAQIQPGIPPQRQSPQPFVFVLADQNGRVMIPARTYRIGQVLPAELLAAAEPVEVDGEVVGYALATGELPELDAREERYLARTNLALLIAAFGAMAIALILGVWLSRTLTSPLRELTQAIRAMGRGELEQRVEVESQDELGELAAAFNQMSAELAHANQLRRQMTADIAHDLRTPLTVISGYVEALRDEVLEPSPERYETIHNEVRHLQRLVEDLRTLSLVDSGELSLQRQRIAPAVLLERASTAYAHRAGQGGVELRVDVSQDLPEINIDMERMAQVLGNLLSNALRHTPRGGQVRLSASADDEAVTLSVQDTGQGIPPEALPHVFERSYRVEESRHQGEGESGLGLAIARSIVEAHGGDIMVESRLGEGTKFSITLAAVG